MNPFKARKVAKIVAIVIVVAMVITSFTFLLSLGAYSYGASDAAADKRLDERLQNLKGFIEIVHEQYKDDVPYDTLVDGAFSGVIDILDDPYSVYYIDVADSDEFVSDAAGVYFGIGVSLEISGGLCRVVSVIPGTPADRGGLMTGDIVKQVEGVSSAGKELHEIVALIRGGEGSAVRLTIERNGSEIPYTFTREAVSLTSVTWTMLDGGVAYLRITNFDADSDAEFRAARAALTAAGAKSLIIDVRNNPGGLVDTVVKVADQLMPAGPITHFVQKDKVLKTFTASGADYVKMPMVLLINGGSASASEILAGALKDSKAATLVGSRTYGKGVGQYILEFGGESAAKLSGFYFTTPDMRIVNEVGVEPDYVAPGPVRENSEALLKTYLAFAPMIEKVKYEPGAVGLNVFGAQQRLSFLGYGTAASGVMDSPMVEAIKKFQGSAGLFAYGVLDYSTMAKLEAACAERAAGLPEGGGDPQLAKAVELLTSAK
jgi:carboxyl-terminal processing protease